VSVAAGRIEQIISLRGQDNASKVVEDVKGSFRGLAVSAEDIAEKSGNIEQGLRGVSDVAGDLLGDKLKGVLDAAGGIEATIKGFGPAMGPFGIALAAAAAAASYFMSEAKKAREAIIDARIKELEKAKESQEATAKILGVNADILGVVSKKLTVDEQIAENQKAAQKILDNQIKQQEAIKEEKEEQLATLQREETQLRRNLEVGAQQLEQAKQLADRRAAGEAVSVRYTTERLQREAQINAIQDQRERLNARAKLRGEDLAKNEEQLKSLAAERATTGQRQLDIEKKRQDLIKERIQLEGQEVADASAGQSLREARLAKQRAAADKASADAKKRREEEKKREEDRRKETLETVEKFLKGEEQAEQELAAAKIAAAKGVERAELAIAEIRRKAANEREVLSQTSELTEVARAKKLAALELQTANEVATVQKALADEELREKEAIAAAKAKIAAKEREDADKIKQKNKEIADSQRATWESLNALVGPAVAALSGEGGIGRALGEVLSQSQKLAAQWKGEGVGADAIIGSVGAVASAVVEGEREKAAILALTSAAQAAIYFATPGMQAQAIAATGAAALYAAAAGGLIGGGSSAPSAGSAGGFAATPSMGGGGGGGGTAVAGATTVINFNAPLGTPYEIGKSVAKAQKAASAGGWSPRMAMGV
jgi:hypothetical protein